MEIKKVIIPVVGLTNIFVSAIIFVIAMFTKIDFPNKIYFGAVICMIIGMKLLEDKVVLVKA